MSDNQGPAQVFCLAEYLADEMMARGWTASDLALRIGNKRDPGLTLLSLRMLLCIQRDNLIIDDKTFADLARAFGISERMLRSLHAVWLAWPDRRSKWKCPEEILN